MAGTMARVSTGEPARFLGQRRQWSGLRRPRHRRHTRCERG